MDKYSGKNASCSLGGRQVSVSYAEPKAPLEQPSATPKASKAIYVGGLPAGATEEALKELFAKFGEVQFQPRNDNDFIFMLGKDVLHLHCWPTLDVVEWCAALRQCMRLRPQKAFL